MSAASIRYADGHAELQVTDLSSGGSGRTWGVTRSWSPDMTGTGSLGNHWFLNQMPQLVQEGTADANRPSGATATIILVASGTDQRWFDYFSGTGWVERYGGQDTLVAATDPDSKSVYVLTDTTGTQTHFFDFSSGSGAQAGQFRSSHDPYGNVTQVTSTDSAGEITEVQRANGSTIESWLYTYSTLGGASVITNVKLRRSTDGGTNYYTVSQTQYNYYASGATNGNVNDLASVQTLEGGPGTLTGSLTGGTGLTLSQPYYYEVTALTPQGETSVSPEFQITPTSSGTQDVNLSWSSYPGATSYNVYRGTSSGGEQLLASGSTGTTYSDTGSAPVGSSPPPDVIDTDYYVYWLSGQTVTEGGTAVTQPTGALKFAFSPESYARMAAALPSGTTPASATTAELSPYADNYFTYNSSGRVYQATVAARGGGSSGQGTFTFAYSASSDIAGFNHWASKTVESLPDGSTSNAIYSNYAGEPMLDVTASGSSQWGTFEEFNGSGQVILQANPSALNLPSSLSTLESNADLLNNQGGTYQYLGRDSGEIALTPTITPAPRRPAAPPGALRGISKARRLSKANPARPFRRKRGRTSPTPAAALSRSTPSPRTPSTATRTAPGMRRPITAIAGTAAPTSRRRSPRRCPPLRPRRTGPTRPTARSTHLTSTPARRNTRMGTGTTTRQRTTWEPAASRKP